jgi:hypothetical protein
MNEVDIETSTKEQIAFELMTTIAHASCSSKGKFKKKQQSAEYWLDLYDKCLLSVLHMRPKPLPDQSEKSSEKQLAKPLGKSPIAPAIAKHNSTAFSN